MRVLGFLLARDSLGIMREKGRERSPVTGERESGRVEIGGNKRERERVEAQRDRVWSSFHYQRAHLNNNAEPPYRALLF